MDETTAATEAIIEVIETIDYTELLSQIDGNVSALLEYNQVISESAYLLSGFVLFFVVVALCYFSYKFFRIFF